MRRRLEEEPATHWLVVGMAIALVFNVYASAILNASYAKSLFPVPYFEAQLSFDASKLKGWYAHLVEHNTLAVYLQTQHIDFLSIASVLMLHGLALLLIARLFAKSSCPRRWMVVAAVLSALAPLFDALENVVSYVMLAHPADFADGWALLYSSFAAAKFAFFTFAYVVGGAGLLVGLVVKTRSLWLQRASLSRERGMA